MRPFNDDKPLLLITWSISLVALTCRSIPTIRSLLSCAFPFNRHWLSHPDSQSLSIDPEMHRRGRSMGLPKFCELHVHATCAIRVFGTCDRNQQHCEQCHLIVHLLQVQTGKIFAIMCGYDDLEWLQTDGIDISVGSLLCAFLLHGKTEVFAHWMKF